jgi:(E)-4-hydroxy-3-methylbut-2-enyl-diphosphate synthase
MERRRTRQVVLRHPTNPVTVGGDAPISVQSMTTTKTADHEATLEQIYALAAAGAAALGVAVAVTAGSAALAVRALGGTNGDVFGAVNEIVEVAVYAAVAASGSA